MGALRRSHAAACSERGVLPGGAALQALSFMCGGCPQTSSDPSAAVPPAGVAQAHAGGQPAGQGHQRRGAQAAQCGHGTSDAALAALPGRTHLGAGLGCAWGAALSRGLPSAFFGGLSAGGGVPRAAAKASTKGSAKLPWMPSRAHGTLNPAPPTTPASPLPPRSHRAEPVHAAARAGRRPRHDRAVHHPPAQRHHLPPLPQPHPPAIRAHRVPGAARGGRQGLCAAGPPLPTAHQPGWWVHARRRLCLRRPT